MITSPQQYAGLLYELLSANRRKHKKIVKDFIAFVVSKKDQTMIPNIIEEVSNLIDHKNRTLFIDIVSPSPMEKIDQTTQAISKKINQPVEIHNVIDQKLIGGLIFYSSDWKIDSSVKSILQKRPMGRNQKLPDNLIFALEILEKSI